MVIINPLPPAIVTAVTGEPMRVIVVPIGIWDMDTDAQKFVVSPVGCDYIRQLQVILQNDGDTLRMDLLYVASTMNPVLMNGDWALNIGTNNVELSRRTGGLFDAPGFSSGVISRGNIFIWFAM